MISPQLHRKFIVPHLKRYVNFFHKKGVLVLFHSDGNINPLLDDIVGTGIDVLHSIEPQAGMDIAYVKQEKIVDKVREVNADIVGMSVLLSTTLPYMREVSKALEEADLRDKVKIIIGGPPATQDFADSIGADACAKDAIEGLKICKEWMQAEKRA